MHYHLADAPLPSRFAWHRLLGTLCLAVFLVLVGLVWIPYGRALANAFAMQILPADLAQSYIQATLPKTALAETTNKLTIATSNLHIEAPIIEGVDTLTDLFKGVGRDQASALPGSLGRVVIAGHRFWPNASPYATIFFNLDKIKVGDTVKLAYNGENYNYRVTDTWDVPKNEAAPQLGPTIEPILTVYTCGPTPYSAAHRIGFNAILDQSKLQRQSAKVIDTLQSGILP